MAVFLQVVLDGLLNGMLYALVTIGLSLIWGVMDIINFAHGEFLMIAMYVSYWLGFLMHVDPLISWIASGIFVFLLSVIVYKLIVSQLIGKPALSALLATFGLSMLLKNICLNRFSPNFKLLSDTYLGGKVIQLGNNLILSLPQFIIAVASMVIILLTYHFMTRTKIGWAIQATAMDRDAAELMGIDTNKIYALVFGIGGACVGIAGGLLPMYMPVHPEVGSLFSLIAFICVAMGGFGSIIGSLLAALLVGLIEALVGFYIAPIFKYVAVFGLYLIVILIKPRGLFGW
ncbi:MAG TPA: branched-chain amino acid ABC transporter permease [Acetomicrobium flavidum]|uniref:Amino acid/amide ABC transporter membrane protein 1, HAAT family n=2 Tax=Acetomicrobium TaxID=49894 RepID=I4BY10_ACEMN|nr:branched-chain amino acid ABC transporter permease [Acetomicrobium mobile]SIN73500.1 amino acid/amide ABC transporter membrane protein 1, HAAT family [Acetomicrobium flavidum]AFM22167.1 amino acid/amide ABC transporter membrane protein 1, HAAT family [Acetomicrobium mobile DSM 13181]HOJ82758.1 branched-chain amino acid ABC transporter permease [Acetomicrobium flavidum]HOP88542.1 branched-chain amino acid ABC transporter permease [Acetomicrobium flavidum]HPU69714.1 branched-chain amino acid 